MSVRAGAISVGWQSVSFLIPGDAADAVSDALLDAGALSVDAAEGAPAPSCEIQDFEAPDSIPRLWALARVTALFAEDADAAGVVRRALAFAGVEASGSVERAWVAGADWVRRTQQQFPPIQIARRLWVVPTWHVAPDPSAVSVVLDPGLAFGTGSHPTTRLCMEWLATHLEGGERVLDYGCGSGILAITAMKLGAAEAIGVDIDPQAIVAATRNAEQNRVAARFVGPEDLGSGEFDVVVANILANPLRALAPLLTGRLRRGGWLLLSGILESQAEAVGASYAALLPLATAGTCEGWVLLAGRRHR